MAHPHSTTGIFSILSSVSRLMSTKKVGVSTLTSSGQSTWSAGANLLCGHLCRNLLRPDVVNFLINENACMDFCSSPAFLTG